MQLGIVWWGKSMRQILGALLEVEGERMGSDNLTHLPPSCSFRAKGESLRLSKGHLLTLADRGTQLNSRSKTTDWKLLWWSWTKRWRCSKTKTISMRNGSHRCNQKKDRLKYWTSKSSFYSKIRRSRGEKLKSLGWQMPNKSQPFSQWPLRRNLIRWTTTTWMKSISS